MRSFVRAVVVAAVVVGAMGSEPAFARGKGIPKGLHLVSRSPTSVTVAWDPVRRATAYRVIVRKKKNNKRVARLTVAEASATATNLRPGVRYLVVVRAALGRRGKLGPESRPLRVRTSIASSTLRLTSVGPMGVLWDWDDVPGATSYVLRMSANADMSGYTDMPFGPSVASVRGLPNNRTFFAQVAAADATGRVIGDWSPIASVTTPPPPAPPSGPILTVASFNVRCANCYGGLNDEQPWPTRKPAVVAQIIARKPDVIGAQEASQGFLADKVTPQFKDLRDGLNAAGGHYELTNTQRYNCIHQTGPSCEDSASEYQYNGASLGTRIFYNTDTVDLLDSGSKLLPSATGENKRYMAWAILRYKADGKKFFFSTVQTQWMSQYATLRQQEMQVMMNEVVAKNPDHLPAFVTGDLNSTRYQSPTNAPYDEVIARGFVDPIGHTPKSPMVSETSTVEQRVRAHYNSHNNFLRRVSKFAEWQNGSNLDYIFTYSPSGPMRVPLWETVLDIDANDNIVGTIPSDHNMIMIKAALP